METPTFDELRELFQRDPEGFEKLRTELIEDCICQSSGGNQRRLRGLQFVIEARRRVAGSPMKALLDIQAMMYDSFLGLHQALSVRKTATVPATLTSARILRFRRSLSSED